MISSMIDDFNIVVSGGIPNRVPTVIWSVGHWYANTLGFSLKDYYEDMECKLLVQVRMQERFPEAMLLPGIFPDYGVVVEASAFGCPIIWNNNQPPSARPAISNMKDVLRMKPINVRTAGLLPKAVETYEYLFRHVNPCYIRDYGYLDGSVFLMGPVETAAVIRGYSDFLLELYESPKLVHTLLTLVTDTLIEWLQYLETRIGTLKRIFVADHFPTLIESDHFEEFFFPYVKRIYDAFPGTLTMYHNEGSIGHVLHRIPDLGASIFHFGTEADKTRNAVGHNITLMGNIDPIEIMLYSSQSEVKAACLKVLEVCAPQGGFLLSSAGGLSIKTPESNVEAMLEATAEYAAEKRKKLDNIIKEDQRDE